MPGSLTERAQRAGPAIAPVWRTETGDAALALAMSRSGQFLAVASGDGEVLVLDSSTGRVVQMFAAHAFGALCVAWSPTHDILATGGQDGMLRFWDPNQHSAIAEAPGAPSHLDRRTLPWVEHVAWSADGTHCASAAGAHAALWDQHGLLVRRYAPFRSTIADLKWLPDGTRLSAVGYSGALVWHRDIDEPEQTLHWKGSFLCHAWASTGKWLAAGMQESAVHIFEVRTKGDLEMSGYSQKVLRLSWSEDGKRLITNGGAYGTVWNFSGKGPAGTRPVSLGGHALPVTDVAFAPRGQWVATCAEDGQLLIWNMTVSSRVAVGSGFIASAALRLAWHPTERRVFTAHQSGLVVGWPVVKG